MLSEALSAENPQPPARRNIELEPHPFENPQPRHRRIGTYVSIVLLRTGKENTYKWYKWWLSRGDTANKRKIKRGFYPKDGKSTMGNSVMKRHKHRFPHSRRPRSDRAFERHRAPAKLARRASHRRPSQRNKRLDAGRGIENSRVEERGEFLSRQSGAAVDICFGKELERGEHARHRYPRRVPREVAARAFAAAKAERGV